MKTGLLGYSRTAEVQILSYKADTEDPLTVGLHIILTSTKGLVHCKTERKDRLLLVFHFVFTPRDSEEKANSAYICTL